VRLKLADGMWVTWCGPGLTPAPAAPPPHHWLPTGRLHTGTVCTGLAHTWEAWKPRSAASAALAPTWY